MADYTVWNAGTVTTLPNEALLKEQVQDLLINLFPLDTPLQQILGRVQMQSVYEQQPIDTFPTAMINRVSSVFSTGGSSFADIHAKPEGHTYVTGTPQFPAKLKSVAEIQGIQFGVSGTARAVSMYGITDRFALEALKATQAVVNNFEHSFHWSPGTAESGATLITGSPAVDVARQTQGLVHWILKSGLQRSKLGLGVASAPDLSGNEFGTNSPALNTGASTWAFDAAGLGLDQAMFKDNLMSKWWDITGRQAGATGFTGSRLKGLFSQFALSVSGPINERKIDAASKRVVDAVDFYETDHGVIGMNLDRYLSIPSQSVTITQTTGSTVVPYDEVMLLIDPKYFKIGVLRPISFHSIGKNRDADEGLVLGEQGFICLNPQAGVGLVNAIP